MERALFSPRLDALVFFGTAVMSACFGFGLEALGVEETPLWAWLLLVVGIDVAHVWATLFRSYWNPEALAEKPLLFFAAPLAAYTVSVALYLQGALVFWAALAYLALFHFIRQQLGWASLYHRKEAVPAWERRLDKAVLTALTAGSAVHWHANLPRPFWWFVPGDFFLALPHAAGTVALVVMALLFAAWLGGCVARLREGRGLHWGKQSLVWATALAWVGGIVLARSDLAFTAMNVALHGVPYFTLVYLRSREVPGLTARVFKFGVPGFLGVLLVLAFAEEALWDALVWHDHEQLFGSWTFAPPELLFAFLVPLLALPQSTHYVLDGFIWRRPRSHAS